MRAIVSVQKSYHPMRTGVDFSRLSRVMWIFCLRSLVREYGWRFAFGLIASGMSATLLPLNEGDCRDYPSWLLADRGTKDEQTAVDAAAIADVAGRLGGALPVSPLQVARRGNVLFPATVEPPA